MNENPLIPVAKMVAVTIENLKKYELLSLNLTIALGQDPRKKDVYPKVSGLFTEENGTKMNAAVEAITLELIQEKLGKG